MLYNLSVNDENVFFPQEEVELVHFYNAEQ